MLTCDAISRGKHHTLSVSPKAALPSVLDILEPNSTWHPGDVLQGVLYNRVRRDIKVGDMPCTTRVPKRKNVFETQLNYSGQYIKTLYLHVLGTTAVHGWSGGRKK